MSLRPAVARQEGEGREVQALRVAELPAQAQAGVEVGAVALGAATLRGVAAQRATGQVLGSALHVHVVEAPRRTGVDAQRTQPVVALGAAPFQVARPAQVALRVAVVATQAQAQLVAGLGNRLAQDDVDGAGDGARTGLGGGGAQDLDALDLIGWQLVDGEAGRRALAVDEDLREAAAQAAQPDVAAAPGAPAQGHAGQAPQHVAELGVAEALELRAVDDDLAGRAVAAPAGGTGGAADLDLVEPAWSGRGGRGVGGDGGRGRRQTVRRGGQRQQRKGNRHVPFSAAAVPPGHSEAQARHAGKAGRFNLEAAV
jgi:hypothetical protein